MLTFLKKHYKQLSLSKKIMIYFVPLSILPLLIVNFFISNTFENLIVDRTLSSASDNGHLTITQIESIFESSEDCGNRLTISINSIYETELGDPSVTSKLTIANKITNELSFSLLTYPYIESLAFYDLNGNLFTSTYKLADDSNVFCESILYTELEETTGLNHWYPLMYRDFLVTDPEIAILTMGKKIVNIHDGSTLGYLIINIPEPTINHLLSLQEYNYWIVDASSHVISTNNSDRILSVIDNDIFDKTLLNNQEYIGVRKLNKQKYVTTMLPFNDTSWRLIGQLPYNELTSDLQQLTFYILLTMIVIIFIDIMSAWVFSHNISKPIRLLNKGMMTVSNGDFTQRLISESADEIGSMSDSFNHMSEKIEDLLSTVELEQEQKRAYELALIQEQIKPHFLYNCLDVIYTLNQMNRGKDAAKATKALADYYRISLSNGADIITLEEEINNVRDYLYLQQIRYSDIFDFTIDFPQNLGQFKILKLSLQPLVENAIYHGLKEKDSFGHLAIQVNAKDEDIYIIIKDNGCGMNQATTRKLLQPNEKREHFGIYNVFHRIQLFFGDHYGLSIKSTINKGTQVTIHIPATTAIPKRRSLYDSNNDR
jgi:two-component system sensor histidine kinase YesM